MVNTRPLLVLAALAAATSPDMGRGAVASIKARLREEMDRDPMDAVMKTVLVGAILFYRAEKGKNPKVNSFWDALVYVSTNLSVGYSDIFAKTPMGKAIGTAVMTWGPAMAANALEPTRAKREAEPAADARTVERLDRILALLEASARPTG